MVPLNWNRRIILVQPLNSFPSPIARDIVDVSCLKSREKSKKLKVKSDVTENTKILQGVILPRYETGAKQQQREGR
jgi:hypothetical protein